MPTPLFGAVVVVVVQFDDLLKTPILHHSYFSCSCSYTNRITSLFSGADNVIGFNFICVMPKGGRLPLDHFGRSKITASSDWSIKQLLYAVIYLLSGDANAGQPCADILV